MQPASAKRDEDLTSVGSEELAEGLMLVRASTLKVIRLQLALERRDRRVAIEAIDDLVAIDRSLEDYLTHVPSSQFELFSNVLQLERSALNAEKHTLAAEISTKTWPEVADVPAISDDAEAEWYPYEEEPDPSPWRRRAAVTVAVLAVAGAAFFLGASGLVPAFVGAVS